MDTVDGVADRVAAWAEVASAASRAEGCDAGRICGLMGWHLRGEADRLGDVLSGWEEAMRE